MPDTERDVIQKKLDEIRRRDRRFSCAAYEFALGLVDFTQVELHRQSLPGHERHVTPEELLAQVEPFAFRQFGPMSDHVLSTWGMPSRADLGAVLQHLVDKELLSREPQESWSCLDTQKPLIDLKNYKMTIGWK